MEFKKMPAPPVAAAPTVDPDTQMQQTMRLMAQRSLHGARGILILAGSLMLVFGCASLAYEPTNSEGIKSGRMIWDNLLAGQMGTNEWFAVGDIALGVVTLLCGGLVTRLPLFASLLPSLLFLLKIGAIIWVAATSKSPPGLVLPVLQLVLVGATLRALRDARAYRRDAAAAREHYRTQAILRQKEQRDQLAPADLPPEKRAGTKLPPRKNQAPAE